MERRIKKIKEELETMADCDVLNDHHMELIREIESILCEMEHKNIKKIPQKDLPLYIDFDWVFPFSQDLFEARLKRKPEKRSILCCGHENLT